MLQGTLDISSLVSTAPEMPALDGPELVLDGVEILQVVFEIEYSTREAVLPPALRPSIPPHLTWLFYRCESSPFGPFTLAQTRIGSRAMMKPRAYLLLAVCDNEEAAMGLRTHFGYNVGSGAVSVRRLYDRVAAHVAIGPATILDVELVDPNDLAGAAVTYAPNMHLAHTPLGVKIVQVDVRHDLDRADIGVPRLRSFDAAAWGEERLRPMQPVVASLTHGRVTVAPIRFVCDPDRPAEQGTTVLGATNGSARN